MEMARRRLHRGGILPNITYAHSCARRAVLIGVVACWRMILMSVELMLNAANMTILTFARMWGNEAQGDMQGHTFALMVIAVAAAEAAVGLAIVVAVFRGRRNVDVDKLTTLRH
jgi:NADH-quinone oxidoreductase subunit K